MNHIELIKQASVKYNDQELLRLAQELQKEAGFLSAAGEGITKALFNAGKKDAANIAQKTVGQAVSETGSLLKDKIKQFGNNQIQAGIKAGQNFSHTLKDGTKITQEQFAKLGFGEKAASYALDFIATIQGMLLLTHTFKDPSLAQKQAETLQHWLESITNRKAEAPVVKVMEQQIEEEAFA